MADLDGSISECAKVCALHIKPHLEALRKTEMVAVLCTNETTPQFFLEFLTPPPPAPQGPMDPRAGRGTSADIVPTQTNIWCGCIHALLRYRSKTTKMQKFPINSYSNENFIPPCSAPGGSLTPKRGEDISGARVRPHANFGANRPAGCREIVDKKANKQRNIQ